MLHINRIVTRLCLAVLFAAGSLGAATPLGAAAPGATAPSAIAPATQGAAVLVGLRPGTSLRVDGQGIGASDSGLAQSVSALGVQSADTVFHAVRGDGQLSLPGLASAIDLRSVYKLRLPAGANLAAALAALRANPAVVYAEPDAVAHLITTPNDPLYPQQWGLAQIGAPTAWSTTTGSASVAIAIIDSGLDTTHPDLSGQLWTNPGEIAGNGQDDDNDGYVDDVHGWNILNNNADLSDTSGHGTEVAGIAAAASNNGAGVAGVCWACKLMVVKVAQPSGVANYSDIAAGVNYAALKGAKVINLSLGGASDSITLRAAVTAAAQTAVVVGGAGNNNSNAPFYPAAYPDALAVAGTTSSDTKVADSNFGPWVDVAAPGETITTTFSGGTYGSSSGTSLAAPFASGLAGLLFSQHPDWSPAQVRAQIVHTAHNIDAQNLSYTGQLGSGRIDAGQAVATAAHPVISIQSLTVNGQPNGTPNPGTQADVSIALYNDWGPATNVHATLTGGGPNASVVSGTVSYGTLGTYASQANAGPLRINVTVAAGYGASLPFTLQLTVDGRLAASLPLTIATAPSTTYEHGTLSTQTWTADRIYIIDNNADVGAGQVLTIAPGTTVQFAGNYNLSVAGTLVADGTSQQPIHFTKVPTATNWSSIQFLNSSVDATFDSQGAYAGGSVLRYVIIDGSTGGVTLNQAGPYLADNDVNSGGISGAGSPTLRVAHNTLSATSLSVSGGDQIVDNAVTGNSINASQMNLVARNSVSQASGAGLTVSQVSTTTANRVDHSAVGLSAGTGFISDNLLAYNTIGLSLSGPATALSNTVLFSGDTDVDVTSASASLQANNLLAAPGHYALRNDAGAPVSATGNWWGTTNDGAIEALIYDNQKDASKGSVDHSGLLTGEVQDAPAYVQNVAIQPDTTLGIQTGTFQLTFSAPMDQGQSPAATFTSVDNSKWTTYTTTNSGLPDNQVTGIALDKDGSLWVSTTGGVAHFNGAAWTVYNTSNSGLPDDYVNGMTIGADGTKWFISRYWHVVSFDGVHWKEWQKWIQGDNNGQAVAIDLDGSLWLATSGCQGIGHLQGTAWTFYNPFPNNISCADYNRVVVSNNGTKWFLSDHGVARISGTSVTTYTTSNSAIPWNYFYDVAVDANNVAWFAGNGLVSFDGQTWVTHTINTTQFSSNETYGVAFDRDNRMWLAYFDCAHTVGGYCGESVAHQRGSGWVSYPDQTCRYGVFDASDRTWCVASALSTRYPSGGVATTGSDRIYPIVDNGRWVDSTHWQATYDVNSLVPRGAYSVSVSNAIGPAGIEIAPDSQFTFTVDYAGTVTDKTPPPMPWVFAEGTAGAPSSVTAHWIATDPGSSIVHYRYAIGTLAGAVDVVNWTTLNATTVTRTGLGLVTGQHYWVSVQAQNQGGLWSPVGASRFTAGAKNPLLWMPVVHR